MAKSRRRTSKPIYGHVEAPAQVAEPTTTLTEPAPASELLAQTAAEPALELTAQPSAAARIDEVIESTPGVMRGSELEAPEEQDGSKGPNRWACVVRDSKLGIRIDKETERKKGVPFLRVLISFRDDSKPSAEERDLLKDEGFRFDGASWGRELNGANVLLAKQVVNRIYQMRGEDAQLFLG